MRTSSPSEIIARVGRRPLLIALGVVIVVAAIVGAFVVAALSGNGPAAYCSQKGGAVVSRVPVFNTNGPAQQQLPLAGSLQFCEFTAKAGSGADANSRISITLDALYADKPTLATLAYLNKPPVQRPDNDANPASYNCGKLGGSDLWGGVNAAGGGWVAQNNPNDVLEACVFPDMSSIDSWGIAYHSVGAIRGADLTKLLRYQPRTVPVIFR